MAARITPCPPNPAMRISVSCMLHAFSEFDVAIAERFDHLCVQQALVVGALAVHELADDDLARLGEAALRWSARRSAPC